MKHNQGLFEGTKAYRKKENGRLLLFRPELNAIRMKNGAERMCMPSVSIDQFVDALKQTVLANKRWVFCYYSLWCTVQTTVAPYKMVPPKALFGGPPFWGPSNYFGEALQN